MIKAGRFLPTRHPPAGAASPGPVSPPLCPQCLPGPAGESPGLGWAGAIARAVSKLSQPLRHAILSRAYVRRLSDGGPLASRGTPAEDWFGVARGAVRVSLVSLSGKQVTLNYCEPGVWFGDISLFDGLPRTHDADAHGETTLLCVRKADFKELLSHHPELYDALLRLNCRRQIGRAHV